jgi:hypothetical protein
VIARNKNNDGDEALALPSPAMELRVS